MHLNRSDWKHLFELRDALQPEDRAILRKLIKRVEELEQLVRVRGRRTGG